jgi:hypothetical protein
MGAFYRVHDDRLHDGLLSLFPGDADRLDGMLVHVIILHACIVLWRKAHEVPRVDVASVSLGALDARLCYHELLDKGMSSRI